MTQNSWHTVRPGECVASIADARGHFWQTVWHDARNQELRERRKNPNTLSPGDRVWVPPLDERKESVATGQVHRFKRLGVPSRLRLRLLERGEALASLPYRLEVAGRVVEGTTDPDGWVVAAVPPQALVALLIVQTADGPREFELQVGHLDPSDEISGVQQRLLNLGFPCPQSGTLDDPTRDAIALFQQREGLAPTGEVDSDLLARLARAHDEGTARSAP
jgi:hypothetical protein